MRRKVQAPPSRRVLWWRPAFPSGVAQVGAWRDRLRTNEHRSSLATSPPAQVVLTWLTPPAAGCDPPLNPVTCTLLHRATQHPSSISKSHHLVMSTTPEANIANLTIYRVHIHWPVLHDNTWCLWHRRLHHIGYPVSPAKLVRIPDSVVWNLLPGTVGTRPLLS